MHCGSIPASSFPALILILAAPAVLAAVSFLAWRISRKALAAYREWVQAYEAFTVSPAAPRRIRHCGPSPPKRPQFAPPRSRSWKSTPPFVSPGARFTVRLVPSGACRPSIQNGATWINCSPPRMNFSS
jgi:hypothetical protein